MINLNEIRQNIERLEQDRSIAQKSDPWELAPGDTRWLEILGRGNLLFANADVEFHYDDFSDINFTGPELDHQEWRAQLNRFGWLRPIALGYQQNKDESLALIARKTIEAWLNFRTYTGEETNESVWATTGDNTLSTSIRVGAKRLSGWWGCVPYLSGSKHFDDAFVKRMYDSTMDQLAFLYKNTSKAGNWRISQLDSMFFLGSVLQGAEEFLNYAVRGINEAFYSQVEDDGSHAEHTGGYHSWMTRVFTGYARLAKARPELGFRIELGRLIRMWDYYIHQYAPDGRDLGLNDDGRWYEKAKPVDIDELKKFREQLIYELGLNPSGFPLTATGLYPNAGQYYFRKSWAADSPMVVYDATNFGGWHCHTGRGGVQFFDGKRMLLLDPGSLNYERSDPFTLAGKQTLFHNTVTVNNLVQLSYADARADKISDLPSASVAVSTYMGGYCDPASAIGSGRARKGTENVNPETAVARHTRSMIWVKDAFIFVADTLTCMKSEFSWRSQWQMDAGEARLTENGSYTTYPQGNVLVQAVECTSPLTCRLYCGQEAPLLGYVSKDGQRLGYVAKDGSRYGSGEPAPMLGIEGQCKDSFNAIFAQVIVPFNGANPPKVGASYREADGAAHWDISIGDALWHIAGNMQVLTGAGLRTQIGECEVLKSDGRLAVVGERNGAVFYGMATDASYLSYGEKDLFRKDFAGDYEAGFSANR